MSVIDNAAAATLRAFLVNAVEPGSTLVTDGWSAYPKACRDWLLHEPHPVAGSGHDAHELLPAVHRVASLCKRWLLGTHQGRVDAEHISHTWRSSPCTPRHRGTTPSAPRTSLDSAAPASASHDHIKDPAVKWISRLPFSMTRT